jgi:hypothetical protein
LGSSICGQPRGKTSASRQAVAGGGREDGRRVEEEEEEEEEEDRIGNRESDRDRQANRAVARLDLGRGFD